VSRVELASWWPLLVGILFLGLFPRVVFGTTDEAVTALVGVFGGG
jgi:NADH:ubiquinone oxidoreductase subunit 4 (subunit M)